jgi:hypothetical protein
VDLAATDFAATDFADFEVMDRGAAAVANGARSVSESFAVFDIGSPSTIDRRAETRRHSIVVPANAS